MSTPVVGYYRVIQYDGSNLTEISTMLSNCSGFSQSGGVLSFTDQNAQPRTCDTGHWVQSDAPGNYSTVYNPTQFTNERIVVVEPDDLSPLESRLDDVETVLGGTDPVLAMGIAVAPTLLLSASATIAVTIIPAMPNSGYTATAQLIASATALGSLAITSVSVVDADTVNVTVQNSGLLNLSGVNIMVVATQ